MARDPSVDQTVLDRIVDRALAHETRDGSVSDRIATMPIEHASMVLASYLDDDYHAKNGPQHLGAARMDLAKAAGSGSKRAGNRSNKARQASEATDRIVNRISALDSLIPAYQRATGAKKKEIRGRIHAIARQAGIRVDFSRL